MNKNLIGAELATWKEDYDWRAAFYEAMHGDCYYDPDTNVLDAITRVVVAEEGENDGDSWLAVVEWSGPEGNYAVMEASCDYTGWDCQAGGVIAFHPTEGMALTDLTPSQAARLGVPHDANKQANL